MEWKVYNSLLSCKYTQLRSYQLLLKLVNMWLSYCENQKGELFWNTAYRLPAVLMLTDSWFQTVEAATEKARDRDEAEAWCKRPTVVGHRFQKRYIAWTESLKRWNHYIVNTINQSFICHNRCYMTFVYSFALTGTRPTRLISTYDSPK